MKENKKISGKQKLVIIIGLAFMAFVVNKVR
jgi:hypothetical protein